MGRLGHPLGGPLLQQPQQTDPGKGWKNHFAWRHGAEVAVTQGERGGERDVRKRVGVCEQHRSGTGKGKLVTPCSSQRLQDGATAQGVVGNIHRANPCSVFLGCRDRGCFHIHFHCVSSAVPHTATSCTVLSGDSRHKNEHFRSLRD